ncbi:hypothetical protein LCGC14_0963620 [marine sediment metagenome]|uniref:Uncharacterized protein n=1 Tax=marine sediment metagenome TaxID=412755 RepID=A0A0F9NI79_9ZZZZ|nr:hypothetical protein [Candidatus Aminicenantes bacterium]
MKTDVSHTSIAAHRDLDLGFKQHQVLTAIRQLNAAGKPASCETICGKLGYTPNRVTGRINELRKMGAIQYDGFTKSSFGRNVETYKIQMKGQQRL